MKNWRFCSVEIKIQSISPKVYKENLNKVSTLVNECLHCEKICTGVEEEQLYQKAMKQETPVSLLYLKVLAIGPGQVGKTTFIRRLTGQMQWDIDTAQQESLPQGSTGQAEMQVVHIEYSKRTVAIELDTSKWDLLEDSQLEKQISSLVSLVNKSQQSNLRSKTDSSYTIKSGAHPIHTVEYQSEIPEEAFLEITSSSNSEDKQDDQDSEEEPHTDEQEDSNQEVEAILQQLSTKEQQQLLLLSPKEPTKIDKVLTYFEKLRKDSVLVNRAINLDAIINLADIGGQPAFLEMLPSLTLGPAMYLVFMKITEGLKTPYPVRFRCEGNKTSTEHQEYMYTSEEVISLHSRA